MHSKMLAIIPVALVGSLLPIHAIEINSLQKFSLGNEHDYFPNEFRKEDQYARYEKIFEKRAAEREV